MRRGFTTGIVLVIAVAGGVSCNEVIGVDEPIYQASVGAGGAGNGSGMGGEGGAAGAGGMGGCLEKETVCDGKDDDCNGQIDDVPILSCGFGVCQVTVPGCSEGKPSECTPGEPTQGELCDNDNDGIDDNCNNQIDEGCPCKKGETQPCYTGAAETRNIGACKDGTQTCVADNMWGPCTGDTLPALEACNGIDDDCDAQTDDGFPEITCGVGACQSTISSCNPLGPPVCMPKDPQEEICNGVDDDCDSQIDENNPGGGGVCMTGLPGVCSTGVALCQGGALGCLPAIMPQTQMETCNGLDDDCNGQTDDGVPTGAPCNTGLMGECGKGKTSCVSGSFVCLGPSPMDEVCNGLDDDCDGEIDTHGVDAGLDCDTGIPGVCSPGLTICVNGTLECKQKSVASPEICDNKDNNCDGTVDEGNPEGGGACVYPGQKGICADGLVQCVGGVLTCTQQNVAKAETCNGLDDDCDGDIDETIVCGTCGSAVTATAACTSIALPASVTLVEGCKQVFPPTQGLSYTIATPGTQYYVSPSGNDFADGKSPATAWKTLCHAIAAAAPGSTVRVAAGAYLSTSLVLAKNLTVKGGFDSTFNQWNPDAYQSIFYGRLTMDHNSAVWGGFRMIGNPIKTSQVQHVVKSGSFVRNYVEEVFDTGAVISGGIDVTATCTAGQVVVQANDMYFGSKVSTTHKGVQLGFQQGTTRIEGNRICTEGKAASTNYALFGYGPNTASTPKLIFANNILESATAETALVRFEGQNGGVDYTLLFTNNTLLALSTGFSGTAASSGKMRYRLTNNILFTAGGGSTAENLGSGAGVSVDSVENNLVFGFSNNLLSTPAPVLQANNDTSGSATMTSVFVNGAGGDFHIKAGGQADETGKNVYNSATYGPITLDIAQALRPAAGAWDRGAYKN